MTNSPTSPDLIPPLSAPVRVFLSFAHKDDEARQELRKSLATFRANKWIEYWDDRQIPPGGEWDPAIKQQLEKADLILFLVSRAFLDSEFIRRKEIPLAMARQRSGSAVVIPIIYEACNWGDSVFGHLDPRPKDGKPIASAANMAEAWQNGVTFPLREWIFQRCPQLSDRLKSTWEADLQPLPNKRSNPLELLDRNPQVMAFEKELVAHLAQRSGHPFVTILFGESEDRPPWLVKRLRQKSLGNLLYGSTPPNEVVWRDPPALNGSKDDFWFHLSSILDLNRRDQSVVEDHFRQLGTPPLIKVEWTLDPRKGAREFDLTRFCEFWHSWSKFDSGLTPVCLVTLLLKPRPTNLLTNLLSLRKPPTDEVEQFLRNESDKWQGYLPDPASTSSGTTSRPTLAVLPRLGRVGCQDAAGWLPNITHEPLRVILQDKINKDSEEWGDRTFSISEFVKQLECLIEKAQKELKPAQLTNS
jgi:hypothetical protein